MKQKLILMLMPFILCGMPTFAQVVEVDSTAIDTVDEYLLSDLDSCAEASEEASECIEVDGIYYKFINNKTE